MTIFVLGILFLSTMLPQTPQDLASSEMEEIDDEEDDLDYYYVEKETDTDQN